MSEQKQFFKIIVSEKHVQFTIKKKYLCLEYKYDIKFCFKFSLHELFVDYFVDCLSPDQLYSCLSKIHGLDDLISEHTRRCGRRRSYRLCAHIMYRIAQREKVVGSKRV